MFWRFRKRAGVKTPRTPSIVLLLLEHWVSGVRSWVGHGASYGNGRQWSVGSGGAGVGCSVGCSYTL